MINGHHYVTLATDASVGETRTGMAYYIRDDDGVERDAWVVEEKLDTNIAEWMAFVKAASILQKKNYPPDTILVYYCDNMTIINIVGETLRSKKAIENWHNQMIWAKAMTNKFFRVDARHVKGHTGLGNLPRYALNRWCDFNARAMQRHGRMHVSRRPRMDPLSMDLPASKQERQQKYKKHKQRP